jgi:hypothetical protein
MEKEVLLSVIANNLREVEMMVDSFKGKEQIVPAFVKLTLQKVDNIRQELELFDQLNASPLTSPQAVKTTDAVEIPVVEVPQSKPMVPVIPRAESQTQQPVKDEVVLEIESPGVSVQKPSPANEAKPQADVIPQSKVVEPETRNLKSTPVEVKEIIPSNIHTDESHSKPRHATLGDKLGGDKTSLMDKITGGKENPNTVSVGKQVDDIRKALGINDRFLFSRELFGGNTNLMDQTMNQINGFANFSEASQFIAVNFNWKGDDPTVQAFMNVVKRRFI